MKIGAIYGTFYDLELIKSSINSIKDIADYIIIIHQRVGFNGNPEPEINNNILKNLIDKKNVNEIIFYDAAGKSKDIGVIDKLNIGVEKCRENKCDYIMAMAPDEQYNLKKLKKEIILMQKNKIETLYCPIRAYYYDDNHYFIDTYYSQSVHKLNKRNFEITKSSLLCDPFKRMQERKYKLSSVYMEHYSFLKDNYANKINNSIRTIGNDKIAGEMQQIHDRLINWQEGQSALVFTNDMDRNGRVVLAEKELTIKNKYKIAICIPFYGRHKVTEFVFKYYSELRERLKNKIQLLFFVAGSEGKISLDLAMKYNHFIYIETPNNPLAQKHNALYIEAQKYNPDACIKIDSDSIVSEEFFYWYMNLLDNKYDYADVLDIYFAVKNNLCYSGGYIYARKGEGTGVSRFMSKKLLNMINWMPWGDSDRNYGFDKIMTQKIKDLEIKRTSIYCSDINGYCIDIKCKENLTPLSDFTFDMLFPINYLGFDFASIDDKLLKVEEKDIKVKSNKFSVIIPTMWQDYNSLSEMIKIYDKSCWISEIIIIDNKPGDKYFGLNSDKIKYFSKGENVFVNAAWNWGVREAKEENIIIANDDIFIQETDFERVMNIIFHSLKYDMVIGIEESCFKNKTDIIKIKKTENKRNRGWGVFMASKKESYKFIPEELKIWYGDDWQIKENEPYKISGLSIKTKHNTTVDASGLGLRVIAKQDDETYKTLLEIEKNFMKVKFKVSLSGPDTILLIGDIITVSKKQGNRLIESDFAEEIK